MEYSTYAELTLWLSSSLFSLSESKCTQWCLELHWALSNLGPMKKGDELQRSFVHLNGQQLKNVSSHISFGIGELLLDTSAFVHIFQMIHETMLTEAVSPQ